MLDILLLNKAISNLYPNVGYTIDNTDLNTLKFVDDVSFEESVILDEYSKVKLEFEAKEYQRQRQSAYPSLQEQLDMQYWDSINGTTTWQDAINAVKFKYPKE